MITRAPKPEEEIALAISKLSREIALRLLCSKPLFRALIPMIRRYIEETPAFVNDSICKELALHFQNPTRCLAHALKNMVATEDQLLLLSLIPGSTLVNWLAHHWREWLVVFEAIAPENRQNFLNTSYGIQILNHLAAYIRGQFPGSLDGETQQTIIEMIDESNLRNTRHYVYRMRSNNYLYVDMMRSIYYLNEPAQCRFLSKLGGNYFISCIDDSRVASGENEAASKFVCALDNIHVNNRLFLMDMIGWEYLIAWFKKPGNIFNLQVMMGKLRKNDGVEENQKRFIVKLGEAKLLLDCLNGDAVLLPSDLRTFILDQIDTDQLQALCLNQLYQWKYQFYCCRTAGFTPEEEMHYFQVLGRDFVVRHFKRIVAELGNGIRSEIMIVILDWVGNERLRDEIERCAKTKDNVFYILQQLHPECRMHYVRLVGKATAVKFLKYDLHRYLDAKNYAELDKWMNVDESQSIKPPPSLASPFVKFQPAVTQTPAALLNSPKQTQDGLIRK